MKEIQQFRGEFSFLSNFYPVKIVYRELNFSCVEAAFQAMKTLDMQERKQFESLDGPRAKALGRQVRLREDWNSIKYDVMLYFVRQKFRNPELKAKLLSTGDAILTEGNYWNDRLWGVDLKTGIGKNMLGKILMKIREEIKQ